YRSALIAYERQRRNLMLAEDLVLEDVRSEIRQLRVLAENYKIQQRAVELQYKQVEQAFDIFNQPPTPVGPTGGGNVAANSAALTQQLLNAQAGLPRVQNTMLTIWVNFLVTRMELYRDLELMPLDPRGVWVDEIASCQCPSPDSSGKAQSGDAAVSVQPNTSEEDRRRLERLPEPRPLPSSQRPQEQSNR